MRFIITLLAQAPRRPSSPEDLPVTGRECWFAGGGCCAPETPATRVITHGGSQRTTDVCTPCAVDVATIAIERGLAFTVEEIVP